MRYHFPISVDMYDFLTTGRFDYLEIGQTAEMILQMFPAPECVPKGLLVKKGWNIWLYGDIELHFSDDRLTHQERETVTIAALSTLDGVANQLASHIAIAKNIGLDNEAVLEIQNIAKQI